MVPLEALIISILPVSELRVAIPLAIYYGVNPFLAFLFCSLANIVPVPFILLALEKIEKLIEKTPFEKIYRKIVERVEKKKTVIEKYGYAGLVIFVGIPLPATGAWTASLLAFLLRLNKFKAFVYIALGVFLAGTIVTLASLGVLNFKKII
ncbi:MAG: small multi-drug export protein [Archaeoglobaceae archaeon]|nr:small multi-drug export protein [Archaeoglobaceae archaeon]MCX8151717.1 small multi-drug export protein [Archaeoglobaceae archaeon]MDW8013846.1 small multi-drug export protein [Archaeoglobaceae archaeon]